MSFKLGDIMVDRVQFGYAEDITEGTPLYVLTQLSTAEIAITAESNDITDARGNVIRRTYLSKTGEFTATNALINLNIVANSGATVNDAGDSELIMPEIKTVKKGETISLGTVKEPATVKLNELTTDGTLSTAYEYNASGATATTFTVDESGNLTLPTNDTVEQYVVRYDRVVTSGVKITNSADKFPNAVRMILKALAVDPCHPDDLRGCYIEMPNFQLSPETTIGLASDNQEMSITGSLNINYCSVDKELFSLYWSDDDENLD